MPELTPDQTSNIVNRYKELSSQGDTAGAEDLINQVKQRGYNIPDLPQPPQVDTGNVGQFVSQGFQEDASFFGDVARGAGNLVVTGATEAAKGLRSAGGSVIDYVKENPAETAATIASFIPPTAIAGRFAKLGLLAKGATKAAELGGGFQQGKNLKTASDIGKLALASGAVEGTAAGVTQFVDNRINKGQNLVDSATGALKTGAVNAAIGALGTGVGEFAVRSINKSIIKGGAGNKELLLVSDLMASDKQFLNETARIDSALANYIKNGELDISSIKIDEASGNPLAGIVQRFAELFPTTSDKVKALDSLRTKYMMHRMTSFLSPEGKMRLKAVGDVFRNSYLETIDQGIATSIDKAWLKFVGRSKKGFDDFTELAGFKTQTVITPVTDSVLIGDMGKGFNFSESIIGANIERKRISGYDVNPKNIAKNFEDLVLTVNEVQSKTGGFPLGSLGEVSKLVEGFSKTDKMNLGSVVLLRSELLGKIRELTVSGTQKNGRRFLSELVSSIDSEIERTMKQEPATSRIYQAWKESRDIYAEGKQALFSNPALKSIQRRLNEGDISGLAERLTTKSNADELKATLSLMDSGTKEAFADVMFSKLINKASPNGVDVSAKSMLKALGGATGEGVLPLRTVIEDIYGETAFTNLRTIAKGFEQQQAKKGASIGKQSITFKVMGMMSAVPAAGAALAFSLNAAPLAGVAVTAGGLHFFLRMLTSKKATALFIEGMNTPAKSIAGGKILARLAVIKSDIYKNFTDAEQTGTAPITDKRGILNKIGKKKNKPTGTNFPVMLQQAAKAGR